MSFILSHQMDTFGGIIIDAKALPNDQNAFEQGLVSLLEKAKEGSFRLIWVTLDRVQSAFVPFLAQHDFVFHNCSEESLTMICRIDEASYAPFSPTHTLGTGAIVINAKDELLVMRDNWSNYRGYKLPGGYIEQGENIEEAVVREVLEETGVSTEFDAVLGLRTRHPVQFDKSNLYIVCRLTALDERIVITDTEEVAEACWMPVNDYLADVNIHAFNRKMVAELRHCSGLQPTHADISLAPNARHEVFFAKK
ncbi:NUDIX domain-containing protein [Marinomonas arenicola]|uniref:NUDIX hydrolase n=1 Tax=Marinomonas arenicola TaxID=569601 RepID=UPI0031201AEF